MSAHTTHPVLNQLRHFYLNWSSQALIYASVFVVSVAIAMYLDLRVGMRPGRVVVVVTLVTAILMIAGPASYVAVRHSVRAGLRNEVLAFLSTLLASTDPSYSVKESDLVSAPDLHGGNLRRQMAEKLGSAFSAAHRDPILSAQQELFSMTIEKDLAWMNEEVGRWVKELTKRQKELTKERQWNQSGVLYEPDPRSRYVVSDSYLTMLDKSPSLGPAIKLFYKQLDKSGINAETKLVIVHVLNSLQRVTQNSEEHLRSLPPGEVHAYTQVQKRAVDFLISSVLSDLSSFLFSSSHMEVSGQSGSGQVFYEIPQED